MPALRQRSRGKEAVTIELEQRLRKAAMGMSIRFLFRTFHRGAVLLVINR